MHDNLKIYNSLNILCVEDEKYVMDIYTSMFSMLFQNVYTAYNGEEGLEIFQKESIDIILTDHSMPIMTGLEMTKKIREIDSSIPIILLTALESLEILRNAIDLQITSFIKKPISSKSIFSTLEFVAKSVLADRLLIESQTKQLSYSNYQENLTYEKENLIIKNDLEDTKSFFDFNCEVFYQPRDILSGDSYIIKEISSTEYMMFLVDGMGKGISAAATSMLCSAFINNKIEQAIKNKQFSLHTLIQNLLEFIAPNLLEEEVVSASFLYFNSEKNTLEYSMFSMPAILYTINTTQEVLKLRSNNPPLAPYTQDVNTTILDINNLNKMLIFSDGLNENFTKDTNEFYGTYLINDFQNSKNLKELEIKRNTKVVIQEDDITYIFINKKD